MNVSRFFFHVSIFLEFFYLRTSLLVSFVIMKVVDIFMMHLQLINGYPLKAEKLCVKRKMSKCSSEFVLVADALSLS